MKIFGLHKKGLFVPIEKVLINGIETEDIHEIKALANSAIKLLREPSDDELIKEIQRTITQSDKKRNFFVGVSNHIICLIGGDNAQACKKYLSSWMNPCKGTNYLDCKIEKEILSKLNEQPQKPKIILKGIREKKSSTPEFSHMELVI